MPEADHELKISNTAKEISAPQSRSHERRSSNWDVSNAPRNYLSLVGAHAITAFFSFASVWLITRYLGSGGYGTIVAIVAASQLAQIFLNWSSTSLSRFGIEEFVDTGKITRSFWSRTLLFVPNLLLILVIARYWLPPVAAWLKIPDDVVWLIAAHLIATSIWLHIQFSLQGVKMLRLQGMLLAVERIVTFASIVTLFYAECLTLWSAIWCYILPSTALSLVGIARLIPYLELRESFDRSQFQKMLIFSLPLIPFALIGYLSTSQLDAFFITNYLSTSDLGIYAIATQINGIFLQLPILANTILLSLFISLRASGNESAMDRIIKDAVPALTLFWGLVCVFLSICAAIVLPLVFGKSEFGFIGTLLWVLAVSSVASCPVLLGLATLSNVYSRTYISMVAAFCTASINIFFNVILIPRYGLFGSAWATVFSSLAGLAAFYWLLRRERIIGRNWVFWSILPVLLSAFCLTSGFGILFAASIAILASIFVAYIHADSVRFALQLLRERLNVKNVPPESSLR